MSLYHNNLDAVYDRKPLPLSEAVEVFVEEKVCSRDSIDALRQRCDAQMEVISAILECLDSVDEARVAALLGLRVASNGGGN